MAVLTLLFLTGVVWGLRAGWDIGSIAAMVSFAVVTGSYTATAIRRSATRAGG